MEYDNLLDDIIKTTKDQQQKEIPKQDERIEKTNISENKIEQNKSVENNNKRIENSEISKEKNANMKNKNIEEETKNQIPGIKNPIDFVEYFEVPSIKRIGNINNSFKLKEHISKEKINFNLLENEPQIELNNIIFKQINDNQINILYSKKDYIGIGDKNGNVLFFNIQNKNKIIQKKFPCPLSKTNFVEVTCINLSDNCDFLFVGYINGSIAMFDFLSEKNKFLSEKIHPLKNTEGKNPIIDIKVYNYENNIFEILSCDSFGFFKVSVIKKEFYLLYRLISTQDIIKKENINNNIIYFIKTIDFSKEEDKSFNNLGKYCVIGDKETIRLYKLSSEIVLLLTINKPEFIKNEISDSSIGFGKPIEKYAFDNNIEPDNILILAISWGNIIYIYKLLIINNCIRENIILGHYVNDSIIFKIGFLTNCILYLFDEKNCLRVLNTRKFKIGELRKGDEKNKNNFHQYTELEQRIIDIKGQNYIKLINSNINEIYFYSIIENGNELNILGRNQITNLKLLCWKSCLNTLQKKNEWDDLLAVSIQIFQGKLTALSDVPQNIIERKNKIGNYLRELISEYVISETQNTNATSILFNDTVDNQKISECIDKTIEFCIEIESFDYLFKKLEPIFEIKNYAPLFLQNLEPYILTNKIINFNLDEELILKIIDLYQKRNRLDLLSQLLLHINIKTLDTNKIKNKFEELNLITPLIYLYMNGKEENYFIIIDKLFELYQNSIPLNNFTYYYLLKDIPIQKILSSKQYIGHKLLWYLKLCITGRKFPNSEEKLNKEKFQKLIPKITFWMLTYKNLYELCKFDAKDYFVILKNIFSIPELYKILEDYANENKDNKIKVMLLSNNIAKIDDAEPKSLVEYLIKMIKSLKSDEILIYLYDFIIKIANKIKFEKEEILDFSCFILRNYQKLVKDINLNEINQICIDLKNLFYSLEDSKNSFNEDDLKKILYNCNGHLFDEIRLFILEKLNDYSECLKVFFERNCGIFEKDKKLFIWLNMLLTHFSFKKNFSQLEIIKNIIFKNIDQIIQVSVEQFQNFINLNFPNKKNDILYKITDPESKLKYIELIIKELKQQLKDSELIEEDQLFIENVLKSHIELLCYFKRFDEILPIIKELEIYPYDEIIDTLVKNNIIDASIYVLIKIGDSKTAFNICKKELYKYFEQIIKILNSNEIDDTSYKSNYNKFKETINYIIHICKKNEQNISELWKMFLMELYSINTELDKLKNNKSKQYNEFDQYLSKTISDLLEIMCNYVSIIQIIDIVSANYKDAELKEFKTILLKMLESNGNQETILSNAKKLLKNNILHKKEIYKKENSHANNFTLNVCDECHKEFNKSKDTKEKIIVFKCGHLLHDKCVIKDYTNEGEIVICSICRKNEIEASIDTQGLSSIKINENKFKNDLDNEEDDDEEEKNKNDFQVRRVFSQMKNIDIRHEEKKKVYLEE